MLTVVVLAVIVIACSLNGMSGEGEAIGAIKHISGVINEREEVDTRKIAITFDDGPHPYYTEQLLDGLKERNVCATFFVLFRYGKAGGSLSGADSPNA